MGNFNATPTARDLLAVHRQLLPDVPRFVSGAAAAASTVSGVGSGVGVRSVPGTVPLATLVWGSKNQNRNAERQNLKFRLTTKLLCML